MGLILVLAVIAVLWVGIVVGIRDYREVRAYRRREAARALKRRLDAMDLADAQERETARRTRATIQLELERAEVEQVVRAKAEAHIDVLCRKYQQNVRRDEYGNERTGDWPREVDYFLKNVVASDLVDRHLELATWVVTDVAWAETQIRFEQGGRLADAQGLLPSEFELECADELRRHGWDAAAVGASGDQGSDVLASRGGVSVVLQCKLYSAPVGNGAVQEVFAARRHFGADVACVVTNTSYTKSAKELAATTGVLLLHHDQLGELDRLIGLSRP